MSLYITRQSFTKYKVHPECIFQMATPEMVVSLKNAYLVHVIANSPLPLTHNWVPAWDIQDHRQNITSQLLSNHCPLHASS